MLILPDNPKIIGQGVTGSEGSRGLQTMLDYGTKVLAGVTPGKGGQKILALPVFNSIKELKEQLGEVDATVIYVPPLFVKAAAHEAIEAGIKFILIFTEKVPAADSAYIYAKAREKGASIIGPSSVGLINPSKKLKIGSIGGATPDRVFQPGNICVISKSGGMSSEIGLHLKNNGLGVSYVLGIGGDRIAGCDFADFLMAVENDPDTKASVIFGELGGTYEERVGEMKKMGKIKKPVVAFIAGEFTLSLPSEVQFGHAGAIIEGERGRPDYKRQMLRSSGVKVADSFDEISELIKQSL